MDKIEIVKTLLKYVGQEDVETDRAICSGVIVILDSIEQKPKPAPSMNDEVMEKAEQEKKPKRRIQFDVGKLGALRRAGWPVINIADEMGVSEQTVRNYMKKEGIA